MSYVVPSAEAYNLAHQYLERWLTYQLSARNIHRFLQQASAEELPDLFEQLNAKTGEVVGHPFISSAVEAWVDRFGIDRHELDNLVMWPALRAAPVSPDMKPEDDPVPADDPLPALGVPEECGALLREYRHFRMALWRLQILGDQLVIAAEERELAGEYLAHQKLRVYLGGNADDDPSAAVVRKLETRARLEQARDKSPAAEPAPEAQPDGPQQPCTFFYKGKGYRLSPLSFRIVEFMWLKRQAKQDAFIEAVWGHDAEPEDGTIRGALSRAAAEMRPATDAGLRFTLSRVDGHVIRVDLAEI